MNAIQISTCNELFDNCPMAIAMFNSKTLKLEQANNAMLSIWDKDTSVIGLNLLDFLPELEHQAYPDLLRMVGQSDKTYQEKGARVNIFKDDTLTPVYMDYSYTPIKAVRRISAGILVTANELSEKYINTLSSDEFKRNLRALVLESPVPMCIFRGWELKLEVVNAHMLDLWQCNQYRNLRMLKHVFFAGHSLSFTENGITYSCTALRNEQGNSIGCVLIAVNKC
ncbi:MAG: hypothetical protein EOO85_30550 [Pedobacter sp.]|nr:MAG: hypothetical protein EOO85_30550 [Pedobacter sp.]